MSAKTITIETLAEVEQGDIVTLRFGDVTITGPEAPCVNKGHVEIWAEPRAYACTDDGWEFVSATREVPEWEPGTVAIVETEGAYPGGPRRAVRRGDVWHSLDMEGYAIDKYVTKVRPLVVIDPAAVDVEAVADAYLRGVEGAPGARGRPSLRTKDGVRAALAALGIEVPR